MFKDGDNSCFSNYRPISILPAFSIFFFEKVVHTRLLDFINKHDILYKHQYGFRSGHSTTMALIHLTNLITSSFDRMEYCAGIFMDMNHSILLRKLQHYGIRGPPLRWFESYSFHRKQYVQYKQAQSSYYTVKCGIPQGSILGPLLFILYVNDLPNASKILNFILFADDTNVFISHKDPIAMISILNTELDKVSNWLRANKLIINIKKTHNMIFTPRQRKPPNLDNIYLDNERMETKECTKVLGFYIDRHLTWKSHIDFISNKAPKSIGVISRSRFFLSSDSLLTLYYSLVYPYFQYGNFVWASTYPTDLKRLTTLQKGVVRIISHAPYDAHTVSFFKQHQILPFSRITTLQTALFMYKYHNNLLPPIYHQLFTTGKSIHPYDTRNSGKYRSHSCRTNHKLFSILFQGPKIWNSLPNDIREKPSLTSFKTNLKNVLLHDLE